MKIAVYGSAADDVDEAILLKTRKIGREIARLKHILVTGACYGIPYEAILGAKEIGGKTIGFSPATDLESHKLRFNDPYKEFDELVFIPKNYEHKENISICHKYRNVSSVAACDACIIVGGRSGTLNEFTIAYDTSKVIGVLEGSLGITKFLRELIKDFDKPTGAVLVFDPDPVSLVRKVIEEVKK